MSENIVNIKYGSTQLTRREENDHIDIVEIDHDRTITVKDVVHEYVLIKFCYNAKTEKDIKNLIKKYKEDKDIETWCLIGCVSDDSDKEYIAKKNEDNKGLLDCFDIFSENVSNHEFDLLIKTFLASSNGLAHVDPADWMYGFEAKKLRKSVNIISSVKSNFKEASLDILKQLKELTKTDIYKPLYNFLIFLSNKTDVKTGMDEFNHAIQTIVDFWGKDYNFMFTTSGCEYHLEKNMEEIILVWIND